MKQQFIVLLLVCGWSMIFAQENVLTKQEAINKVLENNFGVKIAKNNAVIAENNQSILNSNFLPTVRGTAGANYQRDDSTFEFPGQFLIDG